MRFQVISFLTRTSASTYTSFSVTFLKDFWSFFPFVFQLYAKGKDRDHEGSRGWNWAYRPHQKLLPAWREESAHYEPRFPGRYTPRSKVGLELWWGLSLPRIIVKFCLPLSFYWLLNWLVVGTFRGKTELCEFSMKKKKQNKLQNISGIIDSVAIYYWSLLSFLLPSI